MTGVFVSLRAGVRGVVASLFRPRPVAMQEVREEAWRGVLRRYLELDQMMQYYRSRGGGLRGACIQLLAANEEIGRLRGEVLSLRRGSK